MSTCVVKGEVKIRGRAASGRVGVLGTRERTECGGNNLTYAPEDMLAPPALRHPLPPVLSLGHSLSLLPQRIRSKSSLLHQQVTGTQLVSGPGFELGPPTPKTEPCATGSDG